MKGLILPGRRGKRQHRTILEWIGWLFLVLFCVITVVLLLVIFMNSVKTKDEVFANIWSFPVQISFDKFSALLGEYHFGRYIFNSFFITFVSLVISIYISCMAAYGIAKFDFKGMMFPIKLGIVPLYVLMRNLGLNNSLWGMILIYCGSISMPVFVLTGFFRSLPSAVIEAARIDGASQVRIFHTIILPLSKPSIGAVVPLVAVNTWNDFFLPMIFLTRDEVKTVPLGLMRFVISGYFDISKMDVVFAAAAISIAPILAVYLLCSRQIVGGITAGAVKM